MAARGFAEFALASARQAATPSQTSALLPALLPHLFCRSAHTEALPQKPKRFYKAVRVAPAPDNEGYRIMLDAKPLRTPGKHVVSLPTYPLALAVAAEWEWQESSKPALHTMPLMSLVAHAMDSPRPRDKVISHILNYVHTDTACCLYPDEGALTRRQREVYTPILDALRADLGWRFLLSDSIAGAHQTDELAEAVRGWLAGLDRWQLAAAEQLTSTTKSAALAAALLRGHIGPREALAASRLEEDFQAAEWGRVEAGHDLDEADLASRVIGPSIFVRLLAMR